MAGNHSGDMSYQPAPQEEYYPPSTSIEQTELEAVQQSSYLGCVISSDAIIDITVDSRLAKENNTFGRLYQRVWNNNILKKDPKIRVYKAAVLNTPLDGAESWVTCCRHPRLLWASQSTAR